MKVPEKFSIDGQIGEVEFEITMREKVYPSMVARGRMRQSEADYHLSAMKAIRTTLKWLRNNEAKIKAKVDNGQGEKTEETNADSEAAAAG